MRLYPFWFRRLTLRALMTLTAGPPGAIEIGPRTARLDGETIHFEDGTAACCIRGRRGSTS